MATLILTAVGTAIGGPIGGAIGTLAGQQIDGAIFGGGRREGPRLEDLKISTSSYGQAIARQFGRTRTAGAIIWSTDLKERRESSGGAKGKPKTTTFSYSVSFAVALASNPIDGVGRIWADGTLLRGAAGDLKTAGDLRIHKGFGDQPVDPLIAAAEGPDCPAFRNIAYVVFEDLQLADYGNRIPALSFEVFAGEGSQAVPKLLATISQPVAVEAEIPLIEGYAWQGGPLRDMLASISEIHPLLADAGGKHLRLFSENPDGELVRELPPATVATEDGDFGAFSGYTRSRETGERPRPTLIRYYDVARDYQPGAQRALGRAPAGREVAIEFPGSLQADAARTLIERADMRQAHRSEKLAWRTAELDPTLALGSLVRAPGISGTWRVAGWEWREAGVEIELLRNRAHAGATTNADPGRGWSAPDTALTPTLLRTFELPLETFGQSDLPAVYAAPSSRGAGWPGAAFFAERDQTLLLLDASSRTRAIVGVLLQELPPSTALRFEADAQIEIELLDDSFELISVGIEGLSYGANRALVGGEVLQFAVAEKLGAAIWRLSGLLRGRGGTEVAALSGHDGATPFTLIDAALVPLDPALLGGAASIAAIGHADAAPVYAGIENRGLTQRPLVPVHARHASLADGSQRFTWCRRARGAWSWTNQGEVPLGEQSEVYLAGVGPVAGPPVFWTLTSAELVIDAAYWATLIATHPGKDFWVRQIGDHALSDPLLLRTLS